MKIKFLWMLLRELRKRGKFYQNFSYTSDGLNSTFDVIHQALFLFVEWELYAQEWILHLFFKKKEEVYKLPSFACHLDDDDLNYIFSYFLSLCIALHLNNGKRDSKFIISVDALKIQRNSILVEDWKNVISLYFWSVKFALNKIAM